MINDLERHYDPEIRARLDRGLRLAEQYSEELLLRAEATVHLIKAYTALMERLTQHFAPLELTPARINVLMILWTAEEQSLPMSEVSERISVTCANVTKLVDSLEADGVVSRERKPGDRRVSLAVLTEKGKTLLQEIMPDYYRTVRAMFAEMSDDEITQFIHLATKLRVSIRSAGQGTTEQQESEQ